ncbi:MAG TPA: hypothetical protein VGL86_07270 [Polyangia bacterium]|jgi:hypothetical protein
MLLAAAQIVGDSRADHWLIAVAWVGIVVIAAIILVAAARRPLSH